MLLESKLVKFTIDSDNLRSLLAASVNDSFSVRVEQPFVGQGLRFGDFSQRLMSQRP